MFGLPDGADMPYETFLEQKIEDIVSQWDGLVKKKMFGGICYLLNGNMCFGIFKDYLIVGMAVELAAKKLMEENVREFDITGKPMRGGSWLKEALGKIRKSLFSGSMSESPLLRVYRVNYGRESLWRKSITGIGNDMGKIRIASSNLWRW